MIEKSSYFELDDEIRSGSIIINPADRIITSFGSARVNVSDKAYGYVYNICNKLGKAGFSLMTGGGPGLMEAASKGAFDAGATTYGINIELPNEQAMNQYITKPFICNSLMSRKYLLMNYSIGFVIFEGGFGTLDELFELFTLVTTQKKHPVPIILAGSRFWFGLKDWIINNLLKKNYITEKECNLIKIIDEADEIVNFFK